MLLSRPTLHSCRASSLSNSSNSSSSRTFLQHTWTVKEHQTRIHFLAAWTLESLLTARTTSSRILTLRTKNYFQQEVGKCRQCLLNSLEAQAFLRTMEEWQITLPNNNNNNSLGNNKSLHGTLNSISNSRVRLLWEESLLNSISRTNRIKESLRKMNMEISTMVANKGLRNLINIICTAFSNIHLQWHSTAIEVPIRELLLTSTTAYLLLATTSTRVLRTLIVREAQVIRQVSTARRKGNDRTRTATNLS